MSAPHKPFSTVSEKEKQERIALYEQGVPVAKIADKFGINERAMLGWFKRARNRGEIKGYRGVIQEGDEVASRSVTYDQHGTQIKETVHTRPERSPYEPEEGFEVKGRSTLIDADGNVAQQWVKTNKERLSLEKTIEVVQEAFKGYKPAAPNISKPKEARSDMLTVYPVLDWHMNMLAHHAVTGGEDWDFDKSRRILCSTFSELVEQTPPSDHAVFLGLGDLMHADNFESTTRRSGNSLDTDLPLPLALEACCEVLQECAEMVASKHKNVEIVFKKGNHDEVATLCIQTHFRATFKNHKRLVVDSSFEPFYWREFGATFLAGTHGEDIKPQEMAAIMAERKAEMWGRTKTRHAFTGHRHHHICQDINGARCWTLRAPIPRDHYHARKAYGNARSMYAMNYHADLGSRGNIEVEIA